MVKENLQTVCSPKATKRDYFWDTFRGFLMWTIPISHFTMVGGAYDRASPSGVIYIMINVFVMQAFVFLSGYFSKKPERARQTAFKTFLYPYILLVPFFYIVRYVIFGNANLDFLEVPFALWYLVALFAYRFLLVDLIKCKYLLGLSIVLYFIAGQMNWMDGTLSIGRVVSYFPFFILGYYCTKENIEKIRSLKIYWTILLGIFLLGVSIFLAYEVKIPSGFYLLKGAADSVGILWWQDIIMRMVDFILPCLWIIFMLNILPKGKNYLTYVGLNTMPIYILHLVVRYIVKVTGFPTENLIIYYICIFGLATICVMVFSSPPVSKGWNKFFDWTYNQLAVFFKWSLGVNKGPYQLNLSPKTWFQRKKK